MITSLFKQPGPLGRRLLFHILWFSSAVTLITTAFQLYLDYQTDIGLIEERMSQIQQSYLPLINESLWVENLDRAQLEMESILRLPDIKYLEIRSEGQILISAGEADAAQTIDRTFSLSYLYKKKTIDLGLLMVKADLDAVFQRLYDKIFVILASQALKTFIVSSFILLIFHLMVTRHLAEIANFARTLDMNELGNWFALKRKERKDEISSVVHALNDMQNNLKTSHVQIREYQYHLEELIDKRTKSLREAHDQMAEDLEIAAKFQQMALSSINEVPYLNMAYRYLPYSQVSGDVYGMWMNREKEFCFFLGDATGHGVAAAFMTMMAGVGLETIPHHLNCDEILVKLNKLLFSIQTEKFITGIYLRINETGDLRVCNAGHPPLIVIPRDGSPVIQLENSSCPLGVFFPEAVPFEVDQYQLQKGDKILIYTDGIIEWANPQKQQFGEERLITYLEENRALDVETILDKFMQSIQSFAGGNLCPDDITIHCIQFQ